MRIAFASGKGGAGKTTVAASLAVTWPASCMLVDADVEAPNLHLFLRPQLFAPEKVFLPVPELNKEKCTACGACGEICAYKAIAILGGKPVIFSDMCHGCGGCFAVCPSGALDEGRRELGSLQHGVWSAAPDRENTLLMGRSRVGEAMSPPLLRALEKALDARLGAAAGVSTASAPAADSALAAVSPDMPSDALPDVLPDVLIDAPPGVSCPAMTTARLADVVVLVAESTPFGMYDFTLAHQAFSHLGMPVAVVMNRVGMPGNESGDEVLDHYCAEKGLPLLARLPFDRQAAEGYARGQLPPVGQSAGAPSWRRRFEALGKDLRRWAAAAQDRAKEAHVSVTCGESAAKEETSCAK
ncbi:ATP-binding protein [Desulfovibrio sp.]|uniref:ATP-binding protein n=1 Tax=Desulfovibrio sp. TaxID=885 RepID=UPI0025B8FECB|nr:ATP-binding protein [Desulfovibrio sp.]